MRIAGLAALRRPHLADPVWTLGPGSGRTLLVPPPYILGQDLARRLAKTTTGAR